MVSINVDRKGRNHENVPLICLAVVLMLFSAAVCEARDRPCGEHQRLGNQMSYKFNDGNCHDSIKGKGTRFYNFSFEICRDSTRNGITAFYNVDDGTSETSSQTGVFKTFNERRQK
jgi:hypothetical protein